MSWTRHPNYLFGGHQLFQTCIKLMQQLLAINRLKASAFWSLLSCPIHWLHQLMITRISFQMYSQSAVLTCEVGQRYTLRIVDSVWPDSNVLFRISDVFHTITFQVASHRFCFVKLIQIDVTLDPYFSRRSTSFSRLSAPPLPPPNQNLTHCCTHMCNERVKSKNEIASDNGNQTETNGVELIAETTGTTESRSILDGMYFQRYIYQTYLIAVVLEALLHARVQASKPASITGRYSRAETAQSC